MERSAESPIMAIRRRDPRRDRGPGAAALEPRQGVVPGGGLPQSRCHRLLPPDRPGAAPPSGRAAAHAGAGPRRAGRPPLLREELPAATTPTGSTSPPASRRRAARRAASSIRCPPLVWLANLAALELHTHQWTMADPAHPAAMVLDLDPGAPADDHRLLPRRARAARHARALRFRGVVKTSGGKGLHLSVPLVGEHRDRRRDQEVRARARPAARIARSRTRDRRHGEGEAQRARSSSTGARTTGTRRRSRAYSLRVRDLPTVSTPLVVGRDRGGRRPRTSCTFQAPDVSDGSSDSAISTRHRSRVRQELPQL